MSAPVVVIGAGAAGLMTALRLAPKNVVVLCGGAAASAWAQGGIAAAVGADDSPALHAADTMAAGAGLCDPEVVARMTAAGPWVIETLRFYGAQFGATLGLEAAHSRRRILHAKDATGAEVMRVLWQAALAAPHITILEHTTALRLAVRDNRALGVYAAGPNGRLEIAAEAVVLATGGVGGLFAHTTNPLTATGSGLVLAAQAGADLRDIEFVQFHPTALGCGLDPMPLVSEAVRGEGALFVDEDFTPFMQGGDLAARDIVARAVAEKYAAGGKVFLDARCVNGAKFPGIFSVCRANGIDPAMQPIPVRPAAHYHMGGIAVDAQCRSNVDGLYAVGEAAATGLHGANRLASNSLLEAMVTGRLAAEAIAGTAAKRAVALPNMRPQPGGLEMLPEIRKLCSENLGILRHEKGLAGMMERLAPYTAQSSPALLGFMMAKAAWRRQESRGAHSRTDYPARDPALAASMTMNIADIADIASRSLAA